MEWMILPLRRYADFSGRSRRLEYWLFHLGVALVNLAFIVLIEILGASANGSTAEPDGSASAAVAGG